MYKIKLLIAFIISLLIVNCGGGASSDSKNNTNANSRAFKIQLIDDYLDNATVSDSDNQKAIYEGKGVYAFKNQPRGIITLRGGTFENTNIKNKMTMQVDASSKSITPLSSFVFKYPYLKSDILKSLNSKDFDYKKENNIAAFRTSKIIYLMASNDLLDDFANLAVGSKSYNDIENAARKASKNHLRSKEINEYLVAITLMYFDIENSSYIAQITDQVEFRMIDTYPKNLAKDTPTIATFKIKFNKNLNLKTINNTILKDSNKTSIDTTNTIEEDNKTLAIKPKNALKDKTTYSLNIPSSILSDKNKSLSNPTTITFTTKTKVNFELKSTSIDNKTMNIDENITLTFNYDVDKNISTFITLKDIDDKNIKYQAVVKEKTITINPDSNLTQNSEYKLFISSKLKDIHGDTLANDITKSFTATNNSIGVTGVIYITPNGGSTKDGKSWASAYSQTQIQNAIDDFANGGKQIWMKMGTYDISNTINLKSKVKIYGGFNGNETDFAKRPSLDFKIDSQFSTIKMSKDFGIFKANNVKNIILDRLIIKEGKSISASTQGGGLYLNESRITITNTIFEANRAKKAGAGIYSQSSAIQLKNVDFKNNESDKNGGGVYIINEANGYDIQFENVRFIENITTSADGDSGGGLYVYGNASTLDFKNMIFKENKAKQHCGGANFEAVRATLTNVSFYKNTADETGGGLCNENDSDLTIKQVTFSENSAVNSGGLYNYGTLHLENATFSQNKASQNPALLSKSKKVYIVNSTFQDNALGFAGSEDIHIINSVFNNAQISAGSLTGGKKVYLDYSYYSPNNSTNVNKSNPITLINTPLNKSSQANGFVSHVCYTGNNHRTGTSSSATGSFIIPTINILGQANNNEIGSCGN